jgi:two-component system, cell cycle sensor histidine kinase and response regulator CckA
LKPHRALAKKAPPAEHSQELSRYERWVRMLDGQIRVLERERQKLSAVVNHADAGFLVFDRNLRVAWANDYAAGQKSPSPANPIGKLCQEVLCRRDARCEDCPAAVPFATRAVAHLEMCQPKDGATRTLYTTAMPVLSPTGDVDQVMVMVQDISDLTVLRRSEGMLKESEARKDAVVRTALDAVVGMSHDGLVTEFNPAAEAMFGYRRDEVMGKPLTDIIIPERLRDAHAQGLKRAGGHGDSQVIGKRVEMPALRRDGTEFPAELAITRVAVEGAPAYTGYIRDLTERKNAEERLRQSEEHLRQAHKMEAIGTLAGGVAHDFNNILTAILGYTALLKRGVGGDPDLTHAVDVIEKASQRGAGLTRQLLGFARKGKNQTIAVDLEATIGEVLELLNRTIDKSIRIVHIPSPVRSFVTGDPGQLEQVILNLAVNARDAMPGGGELTFAVEPKTLDADASRRYPGTSPGPHVRLSIADTGCGIPEEAMSRIFEPFFTTKEQGKGTGMGLAMVYGIVQNHGGGVHVESMVGQGTRVEIVLPRGEETPAAAHTLADSGVRGSGRILVVDDEEAVRDVTADLLRELGYHVSTAFDGLDAVEFYARHAEEIDLIIVDLVMPRMGGRECYRALKELNPDVRAVLCTGYGFNIAAQELLDEGMLDFISKPFEAGRLSSVVSRTLRASSKTRA